MDDLAFLHERIESYADYTNDDARRLTDEQIRAYLGEALARLGQRLQPQGSAGEALARVLLRCQFADQLVVRALDATAPGAAERAALHAADRALVALAEGADVLAAPEVAAYLAQVEQSLDARAALIERVSPEPASPPR